MTDKELLYSSNYFYKSFIKFIEILHRKYEIENELGVIHLKKHYTEDDLNLNIRSIIYPREIDISKTKIQIKKESHSNFTIFKNIEYGNPIIKHNYDYIKKIDPNIINILIEYFEEQIMLKS